MNITVVFFIFFNARLREGNALYFPPCKAFWNIWIYRAIADLSIAIITVDCYQGGYCGTDLFLMVLYSITTYSSLLPCCVSILVCFLKGGGLGKGRGISLVNQLTSPIQQTVKKYNNSL